MRWEYSSNIQQLQTLYDFVKLSTFLGKSFRWTLLYCFERTGRVWMRVQKSGGGYNALPANPIELDRRGLANVHNNFRTTDSVIHIVILLLLLVAACVTIRIWA